MSPTDQNEKLVFLDGELVSEVCAGASAVSGSVLYGKGVFTTIALCGGEPFEWARHAKRLAKNSHILGLEIGPSAIEELLGSLRDLAARNESGEGKARITIFDPSAPELWGGGPARPCSVMIQTSERRPAQDPLSVAVSPFLLNSASPLAGLKTCNYLEPLLAKEEAFRRGFGEAVRLNEKGFVAGCCLANLFWVSRAGGALRTPALSTGCLPGTIREYILERTDVEEAEIGLDELRADAEAMFVTSAVRGISPVFEVEGFERLSPVRETATSIVPY
ncbi:MAG: aminotransferase class IV [Acidobacteriota bacterium]|nr:MAG: aminotransferase class IV [Acidobacteriota bacterium]